MKRNLVLIVMLTVAALSSLAAVDVHKFARFNRYEGANDSIVEIGKTPEVVLFGNSITDYWPKKHPEFFVEHPNILGRGITTQTTYQFLLRFRQDVVNLHPKAVVILAGTNDIAQNAGAYDEDKTMDNIMSMVDLARANGIKVALASVLPAGSFYWRPEVTDGMAKIHHLNERVREYAASQNIPYIDYFSAMLTPDGSAMNPEYTEDGVHPNEAGYLVMESILMPAINAVLAQ